MARRWSRWCGSSVRPGPSKTGSSGDGNRGGGETQWKPFKLFGWGWDYAGSAILEEGELAGKVMLTFDPGAADIPDGLNGDIELSSADPRVRALKPVVASPISLFMGRAE